MDSEGIQKLIQWLSGLPLLPKSIISIIVVLGAILLLLLLWSKPHQNTDVSKSSAQQTPSPSPLLPSPSQTGNLQEQEVLRGEYISANIGGATVLAQTIPKSVNKEVAIIFDRITDQTALVNVALSGKVSIEQVNLNGSSTEARKSGFTVSIKVANLTGQEIKFKIPKGQIFENKELSPKRQNLAAKGEDAISLPPFSTKTVIVNALCINKGFPAPNNGLGNITIYELKNKQFLNQGDLWDWIADRLKDSGQTQR